MKTSAESLLITISNARRARQTREGHRIVEGGVVEEEEEEEEGRQSGLWCAQARIAEKTKRT